MVDDGDDKDDSKRRNRNLSEKKRRDQFNLLVNELSTMVTPNSRKMDKSTVLKSAISFLKDHNDVRARSRAHDVHSDWKPTFLTNEEFSYLVLEALEGFVMVFSATGRVHYISESFAMLLGHNPTDIINKSIFDLVHEDDRPLLYGLLQTIDPTQSGHFKGREINFQCHLRRGKLDFRDETTYELVQLYGHFRTSMDPMETDERSSCFQRDSESRILFACTGRLQTPHLIRDVSLVDNIRNEFTSRHSLEWKFLFLDHRAPPIIGYLPFEVLGTSGYDYYHFDDMEKMVACHEELMEKGEVTSCYYRFLTKGQQWIWLQTRFYISYHQWNSKPEFVVCSHRVVSHEDATNTVKTELVEPPKPEGPTDHVVPTKKARALADTPLRMSEPFVCYRRSLAGKSQRWHEAARNRVVIGPPNISICVAPLSPSCTTDPSDTLSTYPHHTQSPTAESVCSPDPTASTLGTSPPPSWGHRPQFETRSDSDNGSQSGESRVSRKRKVQEEQQLLAPQQTLPQQTLTPQTLAQHTLASQTLDPQTLTPQTLGRHTLTPQTLAPQTLAPQTLTPQTMAQQTLAPQTRTPQTLTPQTMAQQTMAKQTLAQQTTAQQTMAPQTMAQQTMAQQTMAQQTMAQQTMTQQTMAQQTMAQQTMAQQTMAQQTMTQQTMAQQTMAQQTMAQQTMAQQTMTQQTMAQQTMTQQTMAQQTMTQQTMAQQTMTQQTMAQQTMTQQTMARHTMAQQTMAQQTMTLQTMSQQTMAEQTMALQILTQQTKAKQAMTRQTLAQQIMARQALTRQTKTPQALPQQNMIQQPLSQQIIARQTMAQQTLAQQTSAKQTLAQQTLAQQTSAKQTLAQQTSAKQTLAQRTLIQQQCIVGQYREPTPYVVVPDIMPVILPSHTLPPEQQVQFMDEQLHRKHEELQQMIVRHQAELRKVKEELLMARLGIHSPIGSGNPLVTPGSVPRIKTSPHHAPTPYIAAEVMDSEGRVVPHIIYEGQLQPRPALTEHPQNPHMPQ